MTTPNSSSVHGGLRLASPGPCYTVVTPISGWDEWHPHYATHAEAVAAAADHLEDVDPIDLLDYAALVRITRLDRPCWYVDCTVCSSELDDEYSHYGTRACAVDELAAADWHLVDDGRVYCDCCFSDVDVDVLEEELRRRPGPGQLVLLHLESS